MMERNYSIFYMTSVITLDKDKYSHLVNMVPKGQR